MKPNYESFSLQPFESVGFTGTRSGMTDEQEKALRYLLARASVRNFHHGDCIGADSTAHDIAIATRTPYIDVHPCNIEHMRAHTEKRALEEGQSTQITLHTPKPPLERNQDIVNACDILIATPYRVSEGQRSGTWAAVRYARKIGRKILIIDPSGSCRGEHMR